MGIVSLICLGYRLNAAAAIVGHVFWAHWQVCGGSMRLSEVHHELKVIAKQRVEVNVNAQSRPIICVN
jgi:hypothetical protein